MKQIQFIIVRPLSFTSTFNPLMLKTGTKARRNMGDQRDFFRAQEMPLVFAQVIIETSISLKPKNSKHKIPACERVKCETSKTTGILISPFHVLTCAHGMKLSEITDPAARKKLGTFLVCLKYLTAVNVICISCVLY